MLYIIIYHYISLHIHVIMKSSPRYVIISSGLHTNKYVIVVINILL